MRREHQEEEEEEEESTNRNRSWTIEHLEKIKNQTLNPKQKSNKLEPTKKRSTSTLLGHEGG